MQPRHTDWITDTGKMLPTACGKRVPIFEFSHALDEEILSGWAIHFRNNYLTDEFLDPARKGSGKTRADFLLTTVFPSRVDKPGPATRSGDFSEILLCDYLEFIVGLKVPRERHRRRWNPNVPTPGCDVLGFDFDNNSCAKLYTIEVKGSLSPSKTSAKKQLKLAIEESEKDSEERLGYTLHTLKTLYLERGDTEKAGEVERFQNLADRPYSHVMAAALVVSEAAFDANCIAAVTTAGHRLGHDLWIIVIKGVSLMELAHALYERAAVEAENL